MIEKVSYLTMRGGETVLHSRSQELEKKLMPLVAIMKESWKEACDYFLTPWMALNISYMFEKISFREP